MADQTKYARGLTCTCEQLPHDRDCPVAPYFDEGDKLVIDDYAGDYHDDPPFILTCPSCKERFLQWEHAVDYNYEPVAGNTEQTEIPLVCPRCGYSDKQFLPSIVGHGSDDMDDRGPFTIQCPNTSCQTTYDRTDGNIDIWLEKEILMGVEKAVIRGTTFYRGRTVTEYTELSIDCPECGHHCGETED